MTTVFAIIDADDSIDRIYLSLHPTFEESKEVAEGFHEDEAGAWDQIEKGRQMLHHPGGLLEIREVFVELE